MSSYDRNVLRVLAAIVAGVLSSLQAPHVLKAAEDAGNSNGSLTIGWAEAEITPPDPVILTGLGHACAHRVETVEFPRRIISEESVQAALQNSERLKQRYQEMLSDLEQNPEKRKKRRWYQDVTRTYRPTLTGKSMQRKSIEQQRDPNLPVEMHAVRLGDIGFVTNPFELYLDYAMQIKGRSPATQTFVVQLVGPGSYLPTARSVDRGAYGTRPSNNEVGPEGGEALVEWSVGSLQKLWRQQQ